MSAKPEATVTPSGEHQYYTGKYWNSLEQVIDDLNLRATGDRSTPWYRHLCDAFGPFDRALIINCGNGWVERDLIREGVIRSGVGVDLAPGLLDDARQAAVAQGLALDYLQMDTNAAEFPEGPFDLVVNHAALHHVAYVDRVVRALCELLAPHGVLASWDYVGPHRNQYSAVQWEAAWTVNQSLPAGIRQDMQYPHLPSMLSADPTEAIHSELILPVMERYFQVEYFRNLGGGLAYLLLTHNDALHSKPVNEVAGYVDMVMQADAALTDADPATSLFAYWVARPNPHRVSDPGTLEAWAAEEADREAAAAERGGLYYPPTAIGSLSQELTAARVAVLPPAARASVIAGTPGRELARVLLARLQTRVRVRITRLLSR
ncbi:MAG TPA: class I SAM-dependent methyltransferase [Actinomycetota bacterium]|nr:class I SAM-dependent methyltransferase [Actinomycetota bacterium]